MMENAGEKFDRPVGSSGQPAAASDPPLDEATGLPGLKSWWQVYVAVTLSFFLWVGLMILLQRTFS